MAEPHLYPYPVDVPLDALQLVWDIFKKKPIDLSQAINAAWWVAGYAMGQLFPDNSDPVEHAKVGSDGVGLSDAKVNDAFAAVVAAHGDAGMVKAISPAVWAIILKIAMEILSQRL